VELIFDEGATKWVEEFSKEHKMTPLSQSLKSSGVIAGVCDCCYTSFGGEKDLLKKEELPLFDEYKGHPSIARLFADGYQTITL
jgi:hypothetical protein